MVIRTLAVILVTFPCVASSLAGAERDPMTDAQVADAVALGKSGTVPVVHVGKSRDFDVFIEGPVTRIAKAAARALKQLRPFDAKDVTARLRAPDYVVTVLST